MLNIYSNKMTPNCYRIFAEDPDITIDLSSALIASSLYHMDDRFVKSCKFTTFFITIHVGHISNVKTISNLIYAKIQSNYHYMFQSKQKWRGSDRSSLIICGDVEGTRTGNVNNSHCVPHIHGVLLLPRENEKVEKLKKFCRNVKYKILNINEVTGFSIEQFQCNEENILKLVSYATKAVHKTTSNTYHSENFCPFVFPYNMDLQKDSNRVKSIHSKRENCVSNVNSYWKFPSPKMDSNPRKCRLPKFRKPISASKAPKFEKEGHACGHVWNSPNISLKYLDHHKYAI